MALTGVLKIDRCMPPVIDVDGVTRLAPLSSPFVQVLQKLGKADETRDAAFEEMVANFNKQMVRMWDGGGSGAGRG